MISLVSETKIKTFTKFSYLEDLKSSNVKHTDEEGTSFLGATQ